MDLENKIVYRIIKVLRILAYIGLLIILLIGLSDFGRDYQSTTNSYTWNFGNAFLWLFFGSLIGIIIIELIYKAVFYIVFGKIKKK